LPQLLSSCLSIRHRHPSPWLSRPSAVEHGQRQGVSHGEPPAAFSAMGILARNHLFYLPTQCMEVTIEGGTVVSLDGQDIEQEFVDPMGLRDCIQCDHARIGRMDAIGLSMALLVGLRLNRQETGVDELVAPQTALARPD